jgi:N-methylhydantoinase B/oxoprolinase/acetone carboxylase alpha subunit
VTRRTPRRTRARVAGPSLFDPGRTRRCCATLGDDIAEGDILINNDPHDGGMHLPDIFISAAVRDLQAIAYAATICHHTDVGGRVPGSNAL